MIMRKWQIIQIILIAIMFATSIADVWVENCIKTPDYWMEVPQIQKEDQL